MPDTQLIHTPDPAAIAGRYDVFIGPGTPWATPYTAGLQGSAQEVFNRYRRWFLWQTTLHTSLPDLKGKRLGCNCNPGHDDIAHCHGWHILHYANVGIATPVDNQKITRGQVTNLIVLFNRWCNSDRAMRLWVVRQFLLTGADGWITARPLTTFNNLTVNDWQFIRDKAYPSWHLNDWGLLDGNFTTQISALADDYREKILGQQRLF